MPESTFIKLENLFLALSDKTRLKLLALMADGEVPVGFLAERLGESQPKISRHLAYLRNAGIVSARRDGKWIYYNIQKPADAVCSCVLSITIESMAAERVDEQTLLFMENKTMEYIPDAATEDIYVKTYESEYQPNEIEIYLL